MVHTPASSDVTHVEIRKVTTPEDVRATLLGFVLVCCERARFFTFAGFLLRPLDDCFSGPVFNGMVADDRPADQVEVEFLHVSSCPL